MPINTSDYFDTCWMKIDHKATSSIVLSRNPDYVFSETESTTFGLLNTLFSIAGALMNFMVFLVILRRPDVRKEYLTPSLLSIAMTDFVFSIITLPLEASSYFQRDKCSLSKAIMDLESRFSSYYNSSYLLLINSRVDSHIYMALA